MIRWAEAVRNLCTISHNGADPGAWSPRDQDRPPPPFRDPPPPPNFSTVTCPSPFLETKARGETFYQMDSRGLLPTGSDHLGLGVFLLQYNLLTNMGIIMNYKCLGIDIVG